MSKKEEKFKEKKKDEKKQSKKSKNEKTARTSEETAPGPSRKSKYDSFKLFCKLCEVIGSVSKYTDKTTAVRMFVTKGMFNYLRCFLFLFLITFFFSRCESNEVMRMLATVSLNGVSHTLFC